MVENVPSDMHEDEGHQIIAPPAECHKALGLHWNTKKDTLHVSTPTLTANDNSTKRRIASDVAKTFDLLGWFALCTIVVKVMLQDLCWPGTTKYLTVSHKRGRIGEENFLSSPLIPYPATT